MDENSPIYADEFETTVFRLKDFRQVIENHYQLPVKTCTFMSESQYPEWAVREGKQAPDCAWFFDVTFKTPEGDKGAEVEVGVKENALQVCHPPRPKLKVFRDRDRKRAKEGIPNVTLDYIEQLEQSSRRAWLLWKDVFDYLHNVPDMRLSEVRQPFLRVLDSFYKEFEKVGFLLPDGNTPLTVPENEEE
jgi:hypothetical protein